MERPTQKEEKDRGDANVSAEKLNHSHLPDQFSAGSDVSLLVQTQLSDKSVPQFVLDSL